jgi:multisubunit Na+/H+ antiporter MnhC subunit
MCNQQKCLISILVSFILLHLLNVMKILVSFKFTTLKIHLFLFRFSQYKGRDTPLQQRHRIHNHNTNIFRLHSFVRIVSVCVCPSTGLIL